MVREVPDLDRAARWLALLGFGDRGASVVTAWRSAASAGTPVWVHTADRADDATLDLLAAEVAGARVGWRLALAGPEADVLAARAVATRLGAVDAEIRAAATSTRRRRVWCAHCGSTTETGQPGPSETRCRGCGTRLHVSAHLSRHRAAYLGSVADAPGTA
ncbi:dimethylamine monooxygenase subunit DmmA family protein [Trujillonella humicola]|uniref:dimethylamine monooxygenase subunit DmmA family protein n=1 Tax=Trujillonella humicola TaxID=3383699 RepID=UPI003905E978